MSWLDDLQVFLSGKKTILMLAAAIIDAYGTAMGWWPESWFRQFSELCVAGMFARLGVQKSGPMDTQAMIALVVRAIEAERKRSATPVEGVK